MPAPAYFPLRWESTGDQWWFASPIDWAAANGHYDLVRELLHIDTNLLIKLTSLPRIRRLETVWDDDASFADVAKCRSQVAQKLLLEWENSKNGQNSLIRSGYGGWLLYTAASAGDVDFVKQLLKMDPLLVFGEGEYGVTDMFYAAARSTNSHVLRLLFDRSLSPRRQLQEASLGFKSEMMARAVHAAARGGHVGLLRELLGDNGDALSYRDARGSTVLHTASGRGQVKVVKHLTSSYDIINSMDNRGNTALHVAAYRGHLPVVEVLVSSSPSTLSLTNNYGDTFHMAVSGFLATGFRRLDRQLELLKQLVGGKLVNMEGVVNVKNKEGRTALHMAVIENLQSQVVDLLMSVRYVDLNIRDADGNTPLDLLKQRPESASSEILIKRLISAGGIEKCEDQTARSALVSHLRRHGIGGSPGTSFRIPDAEIFLHTGLEDVGPSSCDFTGSECGYSGNTERAESGSSKYSKFASINAAAKRFKNLLRSSSGKKAMNAADGSDMEDGSPVGCHRANWSSKNSPLSLRQQFSGHSSLPNNKRVHSLPAGSLPSSSTKKKFAQGLTHGVLQLMPKTYVGSPSSGLSETSWSSPVSAVYHGSGSAGPSSAANSPNLDSHKVKHKHASFNLRLMNSYLCFGAQRLANGEDARDCSREHACLWQQASRFGFICDKFSGTCHAKINKVSSSLLMTNV